MNFGAKRFIEKKGLKIKKIFECYNVMDPME